MPRGITLIELLVVMIILTVLVASAIPVMAPSVETRRIREAARGIGTYLSGARSRAIEIGRPVGVAIERMGNEPGASMAMFMAETPPPYAGLDATSSVELQVERRDGGFLVCNARFVSASGPDPPPPRMIRPGDTMRINYKGHRYQVVGLKVDDRGYIDFSTSALVQLRVFVGTADLPWPPPSVGWSAPVSYQIFRQPVRSSAPPYQLPEGAVIDLEGSGVDADTFFAPGVTLPVTVTFTPSGAVDFVYHEHAAGDLEVERPTTGVFFLVGKPENVGDSAMPNWQDPDTLWVAVGSRTGQIGVTENLASPNIRDARALARDMRGMGGN